MVLDTLIKSWIDTHSSKWIGSKDRFNVVWLLWKKHTNTTKFHKNLWIKVSKWAIANSIECLFDPSICIEFVRNDYGIVRAGETEQQQMDSIIYLLRLRWLLRPIKRIVLSRWVEKINFGHFTLTVLSSKYASISHAFSFCFRLWNISNDSRSSSSSAMCFGYWNRRWSINHCPPTPIVHFLAFIRWK